MEFIDKTNDGAANANIAPYLQQAIGQPTYNVNSIYNDWRRFDDGSYKNHLIDNVLLAEQNHRCCYCMKRIVDHNDKDATIEHIIPQSVNTQQEFGNYFTRQYGGFNAQNICLTDEFVNRRLTNFPPYPHRLAYHNFVIACDKCNSNRGSKFIVPLFLKRDIANEIEYGNDGEIRWSNDPVFADSGNTDLPTLEKIKLNSPDLKAIRVVWSFAKKHNLSLKAIPKEKRDDIIYNAFGEVLIANHNMKDPDFYAFTNMLKDEFWNKLLKYDYFGER